MFRRVFRLFRHTCGRRFVKLRCMALDQAFTDTMRMLQVRML